MTSKMKIKVLFFASARELVGDSMTELDVDSPTTTAAVVDLLCERFPKLSLIRTTIAIAVNRIYTKLSEPVELKDGDEVAFLPPISGG